MLLESSRRALRPAEKRLIRAKIRALEAQRAHSPRSMLLIAAAVFAVLWASTIAASDAPVALVTAFWVVVGGALTVWLHLDLRREDGQFAGMVRGLRAALARDEAQVYDIRASAFVEFEEFEDEGACYAFQVAGERMVFLCGQEFYPSGRFPSLDFSLVYPLDDGGNPADMYIDKRAPRSQPVRTLSSAERERLDVVESLEVRTGHIDDL